MQCDQIELLLKVLCEKFSNQYGPNTYFDSTEECQFLDIYLLGNFIRYWANFNSKLWSH